MLRYLLAAISGGIASALVYSLTGIGSFGGILLAYFAPLPLYLIGLSFGWTAGAAASAVAAVTITLLGGFLGKTYDACVEHVADRPNHDRRYLIEPKKIEERLGFAPVVDFEAGLEETVKWYVDHPQWWEGILAGNAKLVFDWSGSRK